MITFEGVTKRYPDGTVAVADLDLETPGGEIAVLVGPGLRQDHIAADDQPAGRADRRAGSARRQGRAGANPALRRGIGYVIQQAGCSRTARSREHRDRAEAARHRPAPARPGRAS